jgi:hypothetical protein
MNEQEFKKMIPLSFEDSDLIDGQILTIQAHEGKGMPETIKIRTKDGEVFIYNSDLGEDEDDIF